MTQELSDDYLSGFNDWQRVFAMQMISASEIHGLMTAVVCVCNPPSEDEWARLLQELSFDAPDDDTKALLFEYGEDTAYALADETEAYEYAPLIGDESHDLNARMLNLKHWVGGFVSGLGITDTLLSDADNKLLQDLMRIAAINAQDADFEIDEDEFLQFYEFARLMPLHFFMRQKKDIMQTPLIHGLQMGRKTAQEQAVSNLGYEIE